MSWLLAQANALRIPLPDESVHCCVCSPPYWGLRDYGTATWEGGDPACDHRIVDKPRSSREWGIMNPSSDSHPSHGHFYKHSCGKCGARRVDDQLGLEPTPEAYCARMVEVFREVRRILRSDGSLWLNLGDTLVDKNMVGIPWRTAFALQADGWYLRSDIIWAKPNPMPESVTDRPTKSHEYLFLLAKQPTYYFDAEAVREGVVSNTRSREKFNGESPVEMKRRGWGSCCGVNEAGRNIRTVWTIPTRSYAGAHFATFPPKLVVPCIKAGTSERGCCPECGAPWKRDVEREPMVITRSGRGEALGKFGATAASGTMVSPARCSTVGWSPTCSHALDPVPCRVLDPFVGSGTTLIVAEALKRHGIGLDLSRKSLVNDAKRRLERPHARAIRPTQVEPDMPLFRR